MRGTGRPHDLPLSVEMTSADSPRKPPDVSRGSQPARNVPSRVTLTNASGQRVNLPDSAGSSPSFHVAPPSWVTATSVTVDPATAWNSAVPLWCNGLPPSCCRFAIATATMFLGLVGSTAIMGSPAPRVALPRSRYSSVFQCGTMAANCASVGGPNESGCCARTGQPAKPAAARTMVRKAARSRGITFTPRATVAAWRSACCRRAVLPHRALDEFECPLQCLETRGPSAGCRWPHKTVIDARDDEELDGIALRTQQRSEIARLLRPNDAV